MRKRINMLGSKLAWASIAGALVAIAGLFWSDGPPPTFAQTDTTAPTVSSVAISSDTGDDGVYGIGDKIEVTVTFSEDITVVGSPQLELTVGSSAKNAAYKSATDSKVDFSYTVAVGDSDTDGISIAANKLNLNEGTIKDAAENDADLLHSAVSAQSGHKVDGVRPTITRVYFIGSTSGQDDVHTSGEYFPAGVRFSEHVYVRGYPGPQLRLNFEGTTKTAGFGGAFPECNEPICVYGFGGRYGISVQFEYMIARGDLDLDGVAINANSVVLNGGSIRDGAGNDAVLTHSAVAENSRYIVDGVPATVRSVAITSDPGSDNTYGVGDTIEVTVTFSESVRVPRWYGSNGISMPLLELNVGGVAKIARTHERSTITGTTVVFSYTVQDGDNDADGISIGANKLTTQSNYGITDNYSGCCPGGEKADLHHSAVADDGEHKVGSSMPASLSTDATLKGLTLSGIDFGTFTSDTESYSAAVAYWLSQTSVIPTVNHSGARYVINLGGVTDADGTVSLPVGSNVITIVVTAEDGSTTKTYTVTVTRAAPSTDAILKGLTLSGIDFGIFASDTESYSAMVANDVAQTLVNATLNDSRASYVTTIGGFLAPPSGLWTEVFLATGVNVITIEVTAEDRRTRKIYTVTVTREAASTDATLKGLTLSGIDFGTFAPDTESYTAEVTASPTETTVTPTVNHSEATYVIKLGGVEDEDGTISLAAGSNVITVEVTAEDDSTTRTYTVTVTRAESVTASSTDATLSALTLSGVSFGTFAPSTTSYTASVANSVSQTAVTPTVNHSGANYVIKLGGVTDADGTVPLSVGSNVITVEVTAEDDSTTQTYTVTVTRAAAPVSAPDLAIPFIYTSTSPYGYDPSFTLGVTVENQGNGSSGSTTLRYYRSADSTVTSGDAEVGTDAVDGLAASGRSRESIDLTAPSAPGTYYYGACVDAVSDESDATNNCSEAQPLTVPEPSTDATLSGLTLSYVDVGTFASSTTSYTASVANSVSQTTVTPTVNHSGASYVVKLGGVTDADGTVPLSVGSNVITVEVTAEDDSTTQTYTVTVARAAPLSTDATLSSLTLRLSAVDFSTFAPGTTSYSVQVAYSVSQTTVTPTVNHSGASYVIKLGGVTDADGTVSLSVGSNVITVEVTAEDGQTTEKYTVTVTRAAPSTDATLSALTMSSVDFGTFAPGTTSYTASVTNSVSQTTVTPTVNDPGASHVIKLGGVTDADGTVPLSVGSNVITIEVTAEDDNTTQPYTVTVTRAAPLSTDASLKALTLSGVDFGTFDSTTISYAAQVANSVSQTKVTPTVNHSGVSYVIKLGGVTAADGTVPLSVGSNVITVEVTAEDTTTTQTYTVTVTRALPPSTDASLSALTMSSVDFGTFARGTTSYTSSVANSVSQTTVAPTVNDSGASYVIKLGGVRDVDGTVALSVGSNVVTVEVTAEDDNTTQTYTVTVTRADSPNPELSGDATLRSLALSGVDFGIFDSTTVSYATTVANSVSQTTVTPTVNHSGASHVIKLGGVTDADGTVSLSVGSNIITVEVTAEDTSTTQTYTITVTRSAPPSEDATLSSLTLSSMDLGTFASSRTTYSVQAANSVSRTTVSPTVNDSGATYVIRLGGVTDADGTVSLSVGSNVITVEVTAEDDSTTQTYTVTVTRAAPSSTDASLSALTLSGVDFGTFNSTTASYTATVANSVTQTTVTPTVNNSGASYVIKLGGVTDSDGTVSLSEGINVITVEVTAEDTTTTQTYTVTVTREGLPAEETEEELEQRMMAQYDANDDGAINRDEVITAITDYLFDGLITRDEVLVVISLYLFR